MLLENSDRLNQNNPYVAQGFDFISFKVYSLLLLDCVMAILILLWQTKESRGLWLYLSASRSWAPGEFLIR